MHPCARPNVALIFLAALARRTLLVGSIVSFSLCAVAHANDEFQTTQLFLFGMQPSTSYLVNRDSKVMAKPKASDHGGLSWMNYSNAGSRFVVTKLVLGAQALLSAPPVAGAGAATVLNQNFPNPFNPRTRIPFVIAKAGRVIVQVFDVSGARVATLFDGSMNEGRHAVEWVGRDDAGQPVASGMYLYTLTTNGQTLSRKMLVLK